MAQIFVADIMTREPVTISPNTNLLDCAKMMVKKKVGSLILAEKKKFVGIITQKDILWALIKKSQKDLSKIKASEISPKKLITINPKATISDAISRMKNKKFSRLPVVQEGNLVGMITIKDILNFNPELYPEFEELEKIKEEAEKVRRLKRVNEDGFVGEDEGVCEECENYSRLFLVNGMQVCDGCRQMISGE